MDKRWLILGMILTCVSTGMFTGCISSGAEQISPSNPLIIDMSPEESDDTAPAVTPPPEPEPTTTPTLSPGYSRSNPVGINVPLSIRVGEMGLTRFDDDDNKYEVRITLTELVRGEDAWQLIEEANIFNDPPESGHEYILAMIKFEYRTGPTLDTIYEVSPIWFDAVSSTGMVYDAAYKVGCVETPDPSIKISLYPDASHEGWVPFHVAIDDDPLMNFGRSTDGTGGIWFKLY